MNIYILLLFLILKFSSTSALNKKDTLVEITLPKTLQKFLQNERKHGGLDLHQVVHKNDVLEITAAVTKEFLNVLNNANISYTVLDPDLTLFSFKSHRRAAITEDTPPGIVNNRITFERDLHYEEIMRYLDNISQKRTHYRRISVETIGKSFQGRDIRLVKIEHPHARNIMFFDAGIHAREWLSISTALNLITNLIDASPTSPINYMNWYIVPLVNPDGYVYSYKTERFQRKNMNYTLCPKECYNSCGVDLNRNYEYKWGVESDTSDPCGEAYPGVHPFSERETQALSKTLKKYHKNVKLYVALHTYGCDLLYPWGYEGKPCNDADDLIAAAKVAADAMNLLKTSNSNCTWQVENAGTMPGGGGGDDYAKGILNIKYSYTMELQGGPDQYGFTYPRSFIKSYVNQSYIGITTLANYVNNKYHSRKTRSANFKSSGCLIKTAILLPYVMTIYLILWAF